MQSFISGITSGLPVINKIHWCVALRHPSPPVNKRRRLMLPNDDWHSVYNTWWSHRWQRAAVRYWSKIAIFISRQHTDTRYWYSKSVWLSVRYVPVSDENGLTYRHSFLPCDAMHSAAIAVTRCPSVCLSVRPTRSWVAPKRIKISSKFFHHRIATPF